MSDFNSDCKVSGCEREAVDSSGLCSKHKTASDKPEVSASTEQIAREAAQDIADSNSQIEPSEYDYQTILAAITAALAPLQAKSDGWKKVANFQSGRADKLQAELEQAKMVAKSCFRKMNEAIARLATADAALEHLRNMAKEATDDTKARTGAVWATSILAAIDAARAKGAQQP